jgi:predicted NBD/HSP70 family sugar kinase
MPEIAALFAAAEQNVAEARKFAREVSGLAAVAVANLALAYDPDVVLLSGDLFGHVMSDIRRFLNRTVPWSPNLQSACFGEEGVQAGAVDMALVAAYEQMSRRLSADASHQRAAGA